jgi:hypothetical protein
MILRSGVDTLLLGAHVLRPHNGLFSCHHPRSHASSSPTPRMDGADLACRLQADLKKKGLDASLDKQRIERGASWTNTIEQAIDKADYLLALLAQGPYGRRSAAPNNYGRRARESASSRCWRGKAPTLPCTRERRTTATSLPKASTRSRSTCCLQMPARIVVAQPLRLQLEKLLPLLPGPPVLVAPKTLL